MQEIQTEKTAHLGNDWCKNIRVLWSYFFQLDVKEDNDRQ